MATNAQLLSSLSGDDEEEKRERRSNQDLLASMSAPEEPMKSPLQAALTTAKSGAREALQGLTFGAADEIESGVASMFGEDYGQYKSEIEADRQKYKEAHPGYAMMANVGGGMLNPVNKFGAGSGVLANAGIDLGLGGLSGVMSADEDESRVKEGLMGAAEGVVGGQVMRGLMGAGKSIIGSNRNVQVDTPEGFVPYHQAADDTKPSFLRMMYQQMAAPGSGGQRLREQQRTVLGRAKDKVGALKDQAALSVKSKKKDIRRGTMDAINQDKEALDTFMSGTDATYRKKIAQGALPDNMNPEASQQIVAMMETDPQKAAGILKEQWGENGFMAIKQRSFDVDPSKIASEIAGDMPTHMDDSLPMINKILKSKLEPAVTFGPPVPAGWKHGAPFTNASSYPTEGSISGKDLIDARNEFRFMVNNMGDDSKEALMKAGYSRAADKLDDHIRAQLPDNMLGQYDNELKKWGVFLSARDAASKAGVDRQGLFGPTDILRSERSNLGARFAEGRSPLKKASQALQQKQKQAGKNLKKTVARRNIEKEDALDIASKTPEALENLIKSSENDFADLARKASNEPKSVWQTTLANLALSSPVIGVIGLMGGPMAALAATPATAFVVARTFGTALATPKVQRYFAGNTAFQKKLKGHLLKMPEAQRKVVYQQSVGAIRTWFEQNFEEML